MAYFLILFGILMRVATHFHNSPLVEPIFKFLPHLPNFAPIGAIALFSAVYLKLDKKYALIVPIVAMLISDIFIGFYNPWIMLSVYGSFVLIGLVGFWLKKHKTLPNIIGASFFSSIIFFLVTNFAVWATPQSFYTRNLQGLLECFTMGLPFFRNTILGDLFYIFLMFSLMELIIKITNTWGLRRTKHGIAFRRVE